MRCYLKSPDRSVDRLFQSHYWFFRLILRCPSNNILWAYWTTLGVKFWWPQEEYDDQWYLIDFTLLGSIVLFWALCSLQETNFQTDIYWEQYLTPDYSVYDFGDRIDTICWTNDTTIKAKIRTPQLTIWNKEIKLRSIFRSHPTYTPEIA